MLRIFVENSSAQSLNISAQFIPKIYVVNLLILQNVEFVGLSKGTSNRGRPSRKAYHMMIQDKQTSLR